MKGRISKDLREYLFTAFLHFVLLVSLLIGMPAQRTLVNRKESVFPVVPPPAPKCSLYCFSDSSVAGGNQKKTLELQFFIIFST
jgi:hypothetical protein